MKLEPLLSKQEARAPSSSVRAALPSVIEQHSGGYEARPECQCAAAAECNAPSPSCPAIENEPQRRQRPLCGRWPAADIPLHSAAAKWEWAQVGMGPSALASRPSGGRWPVAGVSGHCAALRPTATSCSHERMRHAWLRAERWGNPCHRRVPTTQRSRQTHAHARAHRHTHARPLASAHDSATAAYPPPDAPTRYARAHTPIWQRAWAGVARTCGVCAGADDVRGVAYPAVA